MSRPYEDIPVQGRHQGPRSDEEPTTSVRGQSSPLASPPSGDALPATFQLAHHPGAGNYRIRTWTSEDAGETEDDYREIGRYDSPASAVTALSSQGQQSPFIVLENGKTGEIFFDETARISDNWTGDGQYDQVMLFGSAADAAAYVDARRSER